MAEINVAKAKNYGLVTSLEELQELANRLMASDDPIGFDVETGYNGPPRLKGALDTYWKDQFVCGFSITNSPEWARYIPVAHEMTNLNLPEYEAWEIIKPVLETKKIIAHNAKFEMEALAALEWKGRGPKIKMNLFADSMLEAYIIAEYRFVGLKSLTKTMFDHDQADIKSLFPDLTEKGQKTLRFNALELTPEVVSYACEDASWCLAIHNRLYPRVMEKVPNMFKLEHSIVEILVDMENHGLHTHWDAMRKERVLVEDYQRKMEKSVKEELGRLAERDVTTLNLGSPKQIKELLYRDLGMSTSRKTAGADNPKNADKEEWELMSTDQVAMEGLSRKHPAIKKLLEWREVGNHYNRFKKWLDENSFASDGRVHASYNQTVIASGRFSANDPPIQQCPKDIRSSTIIGANVHDDDEWADIRSKGNKYEDWWGDNFRDYLGMPEDHYGLGFDFGQAELRIFVGLSGEPSMKKAFEDNVDIHSATAAKMLRKSVEDVNKRDRQIGKTFNFALLFGAGAGRIGDMLDLPLDEAKALYDSYFEAFPAIQAWMEETRQRALTLGYTETWYGRRIKIWEFDSHLPGVRAKGERLAVNVGPQGGAADYMKISMIRCATKLKELGLWGNGVMLVLNMHDALSFEVHKSIDPNWLKEQLAPMVTFPINHVKGMKDCPEMVADWELFYKWGSPEEWKPYKHAELVDGEWHLVGEEGDDHIEITFEPPSIPVEPEPEEDVPEEEASYLGVSGSTLSRIAPRRQAVVEETEIGEEHKFSLNLDRNPTLPQVAALRKLVDSKPGRNSLKLITPDGDMLLPQTGISLEDRTALYIIFPGASLIEEVTPNLVNSLGRNIQL